MALRNVQRATFSIPTIIIKKLELKVPKNKRSKFVSEAILRTISQNEAGIVTLEETNQYWVNFRKKFNIKPDRNGKSIVESLREDRDSH